MPNPLSNGMEAVLPENSSPDAFQNSLHQLTLANNELRNIYSLFDAVPFAVSALKGPDLIIEFINQYNLDIWQCRKEDVVGKPLFSARPDIRSAVQPIHEEIYRTGKRFEAREILFVLLQNGENVTMYFDAVIDPLKDDQGNIIGQLATSFDVTEKVLARKKVEESEAQFKDFSNNILNLAWMANSDGWIYWYNQRWYDYTGTTLDEMQGWGWEKVHHPDHIERVVNFVKQAWKKPEPFELTFPLLGKDGVYRWFLTRVVPIVNEEGIITRWIGTNTNIHEQVELSERLEDLVAERTKELHRSNEDLQQFAHVASHDLKEPVRKILTFGSRLSTEFEELLPQKAKFYLEKLESAAIRMYSMIDGILLYSSLNALEQTKELIDLNELLQSIQADLEVPILQKGAQIRYNDLPALQGSPILIYQLFYNLINNSLKFTKIDVPPVIQITVTNTDVTNLKEEKPSKNNPYWQIGVKDNGIGFKNVEAEKIFSTFTRLHSKDKYEGTGLGLTLCRKIVERHGGVIWAEAKEGEGASFIILLPQT
jgi:PAS domain S-box-containing protein